MDSAGKRKIGKAMILFLPGALLLIVILLCMMKRNEQISKEQLNELSIIYPSIETQLQESFDFYEEQRQWSLILMGVVSISVVMMSIIAFYLYTRWKSKRYVDIQQQNQKILIRQLEQFKQGNYVVTDNLFTGQDKCSDYINWIYIEERIRELAYLYADQKEKMMLEENSTKTLITDISHQLKTPLASLKMNYELSQETGMTETEKKDFIQKEEQEISKLESLLDELVKLSRLENHMIQINKKQVSLQSILTQAMNQIFMKAHKKGIVLQIDIPADLLILADEKWTVEALVNILDNAIKYSGEDSQILIRVKSLPNTVLIEIEDEGIGIEESELHQIFQRFYRGERAKSFAKDGAGVGLYLSRTILEAQGGTIVAKRKQTGTIFRITFPIQTLTKL